MSRKKIKYVSVDGIIMDNKNTHIEDLLLRPSGAVKKKSIEKLLTSLHHQRNTFVAKIKNEFANNKIHDQSNIEKFIDIQDKIYILEYYLL